MFEMSLELNKMHSVEELSANKICFLCGLKEAIVMAPSHYSLTGTAGAGHSKSEAD